MDPVIIVLIIVIGLTVIAIAAFSPPTHPLIVPSQADLVKINQLQTQLTANKNEAAILAQQIIATQKIIDDNIKLLATAAVPAIIQANIDSQTALLQTIKQKLATNRTAHDNIVSQILKLGGIVA